jgi:hypothetical protein
VQCQVRRLSDLLQDESAMRLEHRLAMTAHLAGSNRASRTLTLRPFHNRRNGDTKPRGNNPAALPGEYRRNHPLAKIHR